MAALDKARPNLPVKPLSKKASAASEKEDKAVRGTKAVANSKNAVKKVSSFSISCSTLISLVNVRKILF